MLDIYDDQGALLREQFPDIAEIPQWIVQGLRGVNFSDGEKLASDDFAVTVPYRGGSRGAYPVYNDAMTAISDFYFGHTHQSLPPELQKQAAIGLVAACERFGVEPSALAVEVASGYQDQKTAATPLQKPFQSQGIAGSSAFPLETPEQVKTASLVYDKILAKLHPDQRREFSQALMHKAAEFGVNLPAGVARWGGDRMSVLAVQEALEKRAAYMTEGQLELLRKSADRIMELHPDKVAELLEEMDTELGIDTLWGRGIPDPQAIYESTKVASLVKVAGVEMSRELWDQACDAGVLSALQPSLQNSLRRNPELLTEYEGHPIQDYVLSGLESLGVVERID